MESERLAEMVEYLTNGAWRSAQDRFMFCAALLTGLKATKFAEIGVWKGDFAKVILKECPQISDYYMVDPWQHLEGWNKPANVPEDRFEKFYQLALQVTEFAKERRKVIRKPTAQAAQDFENGSLDAVYIDGDHTLRGITLDLISLYPKIKYGGLILGDDLSPTIWQHSNDYEPSLVFPFAVHFAEAMKCPIFAGPFNQFVILKQPHKGFSFTDLTESYPETALLGQLIKTS